MPALQTETTHIRTSPNIRTILKEVIEANRGATDITIKAIFRSKVAENEELVGPTCDAFVDYYLSYARKSPAPPSRQEKLKDARASAAQEARRKVRTAIALAIRINGKSPIKGKTWGDLTSAELGTLGSVAFKLAQRVGPGKVLRDIAPTDAVLRTLIQ